MKLTKTQKILRALSEGQSLTAAKIRSTYKVTNPSAIISQLRDRGYAIAHTKGQGIKGKYYMAD